MKISHYSYCFYPFISVIFLIFNLFFNLSSSVRDKRKVRRRLSFLIALEVARRRFIIDRTAVSLRPRPKPGRTSVTSRSNLASKSYRSFAGQHASINPTRSLYLNFPLFFYSATPCAVGGIGRRCDLLRNEPPPIPLMDIDKTGVRYLHWNCARANVFYFEYHYQLH